MIEAQVPEFFDGGYWYVVGVTTDARGNRIPAEAPASGRWCATYGTVNGNARCLLRSVDLWSTAPVRPATPDEVLQAAQTDGFHPSDLHQKPEMRFGGQ